MRKFTCPPDAEVLGQNIRAWAENLQGEDTTPIMQKYGLVNVDPNGWYSVKALMDAMNEIVSNPNSSPNMVAIGLEIGRIVPMPPDMPDPTLGQVLMMWNGIYQYLHRNGDVGAINVEKMSETHYKVTFTDLYPDDFSYGIMYGYARRFLPRGTRFKVFYDEAVTPRDQGGTGATVIHLKWD
jgi:hypothetical protein